MRPAKDLLEIGWELLQLMKGDPPANLGRYQKNLTTEQSGLMKDKLFKVGGSIGVGGEFDFNLSVFWTIEKQNEVCQTMLANWHP